MNPSGAYGPTPNAGGGFPPPVPMSPAAPPPRSYAPIETVVPDPVANARYAEAFAAFPHIAALSPTPTLVSAYETAYAQLSPERFYQFKMWLQSPEGENYKQWEDRARQLLEVIEPINARWAQGWINAELSLLRPLHDYLDIYDQFTRQLLTHADLNPAARHAQLYGASDPANPLPYDILLQRVPERGRLQELLASYDEFWRSNMGVEFAAGWRSSWGPAEHDPFVIAEGLRTITGSVTSRLWSAAELPEVPSLPPYAPAATGLPESMSALQQEICALTGGGALPTHVPPAEFHPDSYPTPMAPANPRWSRGDFYTGRAVVYRNKAPWAEAVALEVAMGNAGMAPSVCVQRYDGSVGWFPVGDILGIR
ncbi:hypothetical protein [Cumulibacter soli]|uniref:hypothetical protein n=1 Tax=Cumulibacter soli TaxID=2546344 RepID=UPI00106846E2|nr:hypothetical protein [Cumulibacter soli]